MQPAATELFDHAIDEIGRRRRRIEVFVVELHRLPFELAKLVEWLYLHPLDILHRGDEPGYAIDVGRIVRKSRHQRESHPHALAERGEPLGKPQGRRQFPAGDVAIGLRIRTLDVEQDKIEIGQISVVGLGAEISGRLDGRMKAHLLGRSQYPPGEGKLHHRLAARDGQAAIKRAQRRRKAAEAINYLLRRDVGTVLQMPGVGVMTIGAAQKASRDEQHDPQAGPIVARCGLVGMSVAEFAASLFRRLAFIRCVGGNSDAQVMPAARLQRSKV